MTAVFLPKAGRAAVEFLEVGGDEQDFRVVPGARADPVAGVHGRLVWLADMLR